MLVSAAALALPVLHLAAQARAAPAPVEARREQAQRFLEKRGVLVHASARQLAEARSARPGSRLSAAAKPAYGPALLSQPWQSLGPAQISTSAFGEVTGRVTGIAADPSDATGNTVYLGTTGGGVWKSINAAGSASSAVFTPLTDTLPIFTSGNTASLSIGAVSVQPGGTGVVLAGTGDPNDALDSYYGTGILRSTDGGVTWSLIPESSDFSVNSLTNFYFFGLASAGFAWSATNTNLVVAAISQSADGLLVNAIDTESEPADSLSVKGLYYSEDAGATWKLATITDGPGQVVQSSLVIVGGGGNAATAVVWNPGAPAFLCGGAFPRLLRIARRNHLDAARPPAWYGADHHRVPRPIRTIRAHRHAPSFAGRSRRSLFRVICSPSPLMQTCSTRGSGKMHARGPPGAHARRIA